MPADTTTNQIRRSFQRIAARLRTRVGNGDSNGLATHILTVIADELEFEAMGKKDKG